MARRSEKAVSEVHRGAPDRSKDHLVENREVYPGRRCEITIGSERHRAHEAGRRRALRRDAQLHRHHCLDVVGRDLDAGRGELSPEGEVRRRLLG